MKQAIVDEFSELPISRQRKYQMRRARDQRCTQCGEPVVIGTRCLKHLIDARERQRESQSLKRRYYNTLSYKLTELIMRPVAAGPRSRKQNPRENVKASAASSRRVRNPRASAGKEVGNRPARGVRPKVILKPTGT